MRCRNLARWLPILIAFLLTVGILLAGVDWSKPVELGPRATGALHSYTAGQPATGVLPAYTGPAYSAGDLRISGCIFRLYSTGPEIHENNGHTCLGVSDVGINANGSLEITHSPGGPVIACIAEADETLAVRGIITGCSGGVGPTSIVKFYDTDTGNEVDADSAAVTGPYNNVWVLWVNDGATH